MRWRVFVFLAAGLLAAAPCAHAQDTPHQAEYLKIYLKINDADELERKGDYRGALADFKDCYARLQKIHNDDPSWESALVIHRMDDCQAKILYLESEVAKLPPETPGGDETGGGVAPSGTSSQEMDEMRQKLADVQQQLQDISAKYQNEQIENNNLRTQLDAANQELIALKSGQNEDERMGKMLDENKRLTDKLATAEKQIATMKPANPKSALAEARAEAKNVQDQLAASQAQNQALQTTVSTLQSQLDQAQSDLRAANERLADAAPSNPDYEKLKRENEIMRDILTRELQEQAHRDMAKRLAQDEFDRLKIDSKVLQEQLDILGSPMTPAQNDQERILLDSLKTTSVNVAAVPSGDQGNNFSATAPSTNAPADNGGGAANPAAPSNPSTPDNTMASTPADTNAVTVVTPPASTNAAPATPPADTTAVAPTTPDNMASTNSAPSTNSVTASADTNSAPASTNMAETPATTDTNMAGSPSAPDTNNPASAPVPPTSTPTGTTTVTDTTISNGGSSTTPDSTDYSTKARLPDDMRDTAQQAADLFKMQRYDEAADKYQTIIEKYPDSLYAWSNLGVVRFQQGKLPEALKALQQAVKLSPTDAFSYSNLGIVYYQLGQYENAISALERALALDPTNAMSHNYLGCACSQKGWQEVAEKEFTKAIELNDNFADAHFNLALIYATEKPPSLEMARRHYKRALELGIQPNPQLEKLLRMDEGQVELQQTTPAGGSQVSDAAK
jgi:Flp pilus assembly protein TadD